MRKGLGVCAVAVFGLFFSLPQDITTDRARKFPVLGKGGIQMDPFGSSGEASPYASATACWSFNDPTDLGNEDCTSTYDLTLVNTPTATGGALGYAANLTAASSQYATGGDIFDSGTGVSWGVAGWIDQITAATQGVFMKGNLGTNGDFGIQVNDTTTLRCRMNGGGIVTDDMAIASSVARQFIHCRYNATANELEAGQNAVWTGSPAAPPNDGTSNANPFVVGALSGPPSNYFGGAVGTVLFYRSVSGGNILTDAIATSLYNSGKGKTCADLTAAEQVNLVSCWEMDEDGGPYADSIGSNNLTGVNTPTQAAGLVERSDSGMSVELVNASAQSLQYATPITGIKTVSAWINNKGAANYYGVVTTNGGTRQSELFMYGATGVQCTFYDTGATASTAVSFTGATLNTWIHLVCINNPTGSGGDGKTRLWQDGAVEQASATVLADHRTAVGTFNIGSFSGSFDGAVDDVAVWPIALTNDQIAELWNAGAGTFYASAWGDMIHNGPYYASADPIMLQPLRYPPPSSRRFYVR